MLVVDAAERSILRDAATIAGATGIIGMSFGVLAVGKGISTTMTCGMSLLVFAGGSQFVLASAAGTSLVTAVVAALLLNLRHVAYGLSIAPFLRGNLLVRAISSHLVLDESTAYSLSQPEPRLSRRAFYAVGVLLFACWQIGTLAGALLGTSIGDPRRYGIDAAFPAALLAMLWPSLDSLPVRLAAVAGAVIAVGMTPVVSPGIPIMLAGLGVLVAIAFDRR